MSYSRILKDHLFLTGLGYKQQVRTCECVKVCVSTVCDLETRCLREEKYIPAGDGVSVCASSWEREKSVHLCECIFCCTCPPECFFLSLRMYCVIFVHVNRKWKRSRAWEREVKVGSVCDITNLTEHISKSKLNSFCFLMLFGLFFPFYGPTKNVPRLYW